MTQVLFKTPDGTASAETFGNGQPAQLTFPQGWAETLEYDELMWSLMDHGYAPDPRMRTTLPDGRVRQYHPSGYRVPPRRVAA